MKNKDIDESKKERKKKLKREKSIDGILQSLISEFRFLSESHKNKWV